MYEFYITYIIIKKKNLTRLIPLRSVKIIKFLLIVFRCFSIFVFRRDRINSDLWLINERRKVRINKNSIHVYAHLRTNQKKKKGRKINIHQNLYYHKCKIIYFHSFIAYRYFEFCRDRINSDLWFINEPRKIRMNKKCVFTINAYLHLRTDKNKKIKNKIYIKICIAINSKSFLPILS